MSIWAIVPVKPLNRAKSRLADLLSGEQREKLALGMLHYNLQVLSTIPMIDGILVISRDMKVLAESRDYPGVQTLQESGTPELNNALRRANRMLIAWGAEASLVIPADIPLITADDIVGVLSHGQALNSIVLVPDRHHDGTNAMFTRPPGLIDYSFGRGSFSRHMHIAKSDGYRPHTLESERLGLDVDTPDDLALYLKMAQKLGQSVIPY